MYRQLRSDPDLQEVHRRFPYVVIWDDHEHSNDAWQDVVNEFEGARGEQRDTSRREAATQAWVEYVGLMLPDGQVVEGIWPAPSDLSSDCG